MKCILSLKVLDKHAFSILGQNEFQSFDISIGCSNHESSISIIIANVDVGKFSKIFNGLFVLNEYGHHERTVAIIVSFIDDIRKLLAKLLQNLLVLLRNTEVKDCFSITKKRYSIFYQ